MSMCYCYYSCCCVVFFFKQKTAYEMRISDWSSDVCSSDLREEIADEWPTKGLSACASGEPLVRPHRRWRVLGLLRTRTSHHGFAHMPRGGDQAQNRLTSPPCLVERILRSEEHTSDLQSLMRISYAVFCLKTQNTSNLTHYTTSH